MVLAQDFVTRWRGVEVLRLQNINLWVTEIRGALRKALQVHATQEAVHGGTVEEKGGPHQV